MSTIDVNSLSFFLSLGVPTTPKGEPGRVTGVVLEEAAVLSLQGFQSQSESRTHFHDDSTRLDSSFRSSISHRAWLA